MNHQVTENLKWIVKKIYFKIRNIIYDVYFICYKLVCRFSSKKILFFDKPGWEPDLKKGFKYSSHSVEFGTLDDKSSDKYDLILPLTIESLLDPKVRTLIENNLIPLPSVDSILLCDDKIKFNELMISKGFREYIPKLEKQFSFPYILKKKQDEYGANAFIIHNSEEEQIFSEQINSSDFFSQEFIKGRNEYATHILIVNNEIIKSLTIKYIFKTELSIKGKQKQLIKTITHCPYLGLFASILQTIGFEGICCFNYKIKDNKPYILEINPRLGGSLCSYFYLFINI